MMEGLARALKGRGEEIRVLGRSRGEFECVNYP